MSLPFSERRQQPRTDGPTGHARIDPSRLATEESKPVTTLLRNLVDETRLLVREEARLARAETRETVGEVASSLKMVGIGAAIGLAAILALAAALNRGLTVFLAQRIDPDVAVWLAPLILAVLFGVIAASLVKRGMAKVRAQSLVPEKAKQSLMEDKEWLKQKVG